MINATIFCDTTSENSEGLVIGFKVKNHGDTHVCAAVSMLTINTVNSIEKLTTLKDFDVKWDESGGYLEFKLHDSSFRNTGAGLLLDALVLGLTDVAQEYPQELELKRM